MKNPLKVVWIVLGFLCLGLGTIGIVLPILPTVPFYMATLFCFAKSSKKLHDWCSEKSHDNRNKMQDYRNGNGSHGNRLYLHEECTNRKNLYRSGLGMPPVILLPSSENFKSERRITGRCRSGII